jgi:hypothetical protein
MTKMNEKLGLEKLEIKLQESIPQAQSTTLNAAQELPFKSASG